MLKKRLICLFTALGLSLCLSGCDKKDNEKTDSKKNSVTTTVTTTTVDSTNTEEPDLLLFELNGSKEYTDKYLDADNKVQLVSFVKYQSLFEGLYLCDLMVLSYDDSHAVVYCEFSEHPDNLYDDVAKETKSVVYKIDRQTKEISDLIELDSQSAYLENKSEGFVISDETDEGLVYTIYDYDLNKLYSFNYQKYDSAFVSEDCRRIYYCFENQLYVYNSNDDTSAICFDTQDFYITNISGIITKDSNDYILGEIIREDLNRYQAIINTAGEILACYDFELQPFYCNKNLLIAPLVDMTFTKEQYIVGNNENSQFVFEYEYNDEHESMLFMAINEDMILVSYDKENTLYLEIYSTINGELTASCNFDYTPMLADPDRVREHFGFTEGDDLSGLDKPYIFENPFTLKDDTIVIPMTNSLSDKYFVVWELSDSEVSQGIVNVSKYQSGLLENIENVEKITDLFFPEEYSTDFEELNQKAEVLEDKYGINIRLEAECGMYGDGYVISPLYDYDTTQKALDTLEKELSKYPDNFFKQISNVTLMKTEFLIAGSISNPIENTQKSCLLHMTNGSYKLVYDCTSNEGFSSEIHHPISHMIDSYLEICPENIYIDMEWMFVNPEDEAYMIEPEALGEEYFYTDCIASGQSTSQAYFIDRNSIIGSEDRATIFEAVMSDEVYDIDFNLAPNLKEKLNFYAKYIDLAFDTDGWENVYWKKYI